MAVLGPSVKCHRCGATLRIEGDGKLPTHDIKGSNIPCLGSRERPKYGKGQVS